jgi:hypothetical protein
MSYILYRNKSLLRPDGFLDCFECLAYSVLIELDFAKTEDGVCVSLQAHLRLLHFRLTVCPERLQANPSSLGDLLAFLCNLGND